MRCPMDMDALLCFAPLPLNAAVRCPAVLCMSISNEIIRLPLERGDIQNQSLGRDVCVQGSEHALRPLPRALRYGYLRSG